VLNPFLIGRDVYLRPIELEDAATYVRWLNNPEVSRFLEAGAFPLNRLREEDYIRNLYSDDHGTNLALVLKQEDRHIGGIGLSSIQWPARRAVIGIVIGEQDCWGKGYGTQAMRLMLGHAFNTLNLNRVALRVFESNARARACYLKVGFQEEGRLRQDRFAGGRYEDVLLMSVLRSEWAPEAARK
jgi:RimJ/RimL family protein N-acetyltransferase